ncbi:Spy/CpxP family protein refolding chaperone [Marinobacter sp. SS21]|uniref:Spy/CpxP family protein refolding chaperone n=1 Tax=Marinobacter sp. SS21 TaxID=2979460 RepID=UPI00232B27ED|nr:Spy/CpxP family protein refolding chaperone [Marinobacter sp. SS21]MDC0662532.1 Spy/CpxP family protein refolding chaperone [Marinobacter sp. SS21]
MKLLKPLATLLFVMTLVNPVWAQQPDQVDRLAEMVGLSDEQQTEIRTIIEDLQSEIQALRVEAQQLQQQLQTQVKPDYDEAAIRADAGKLGELTGEISALSTLLQAKVDAVFTQEQRDELDRKMREMQQRMQQGGLPQNQQ